MIVYNVTTQINPAIEKDWLLWQQQEHIPEIRALGLFTDHTFYRLLEADSISYITQFFAPTMNDYETYINDHAPLLRQKALDRWGNQFIAFHTVMKVVN